MTAADTAHTLAALAAAVEDGLRAGANASQATASSWGHEGVWVHADITAALAALADYKRRVSELEAFVSKWAAFEFADVTMDDETSDMQRAARALLAAGSEVGDGQR